MTFIDEGPSEIPELLSDMLVLCEELIFKMCDRLARGEKEPRDELLKSVIKMIESDLEEDDE